MRRNESSAPLYSRLFRGFALGICYTISVIFLLLLLAFKVDAAEITELPEYKILEDEYVDIVDSDTLMDGFISVSGGDSIGPLFTENEVESAPIFYECTCGETIVSYLEVQALSDEEEEIIYTDLSEFENSPALVDRYQYELIKRLEYLQYSLTILIALIFILIFRKK